jgi:hypothetical protein
LLLKVRFRIEFFDFRVWVWWAPEGKWRLNLSKYGALTQDILLLFMSIITENPVKSHFFNPLLWYCNMKKFHNFWKRFKGIVSRDFVVCFLVSFDRFYIFTHQERVLLLLKVRFVSNFLIFVFGCGEPRKENGA